MKIQNNRAKGRMVFLVLFWIAQATAATDQPGWKYKELNALREMRKNLKSGTELRVSVNRIASLNGQVIWVGGSYRTAAQSYRSLMWRSLDGGRSWSEIDEWMAGSEVCEIFILDEQRVWFITAWSVEGSQAPYFIFRTDDGGKTWRRTETPMPSGIVTSLSYVTDFFFETPLRGEITFVSTMGEMHTYRSLDGGATWRILTAQKIDPDRDWTAGPSSRKGQPTQRLRYKAVPDEEHHIIFVEKYDPPTQEWKRVGYLPCLYELNGDGLSPVIKRFTPPQKTKP